MSVETPQVSTRLSGYANTRFYGENFEVLPLFVSSDPRDAADGRIRPFGTF